MNVYCAGAFKAVCTENAPASAVMAVARSKFGNYERMRELKTRKIASILKQDSDTHKNSTMKLFSHPHFECNESIFADKCYIK